MQCGYRSTPNKGLREMNERPRSPVMTLQRFVAEWTETSIDLIQNLAAKSSDPQTRDLVLSLVQADMELRWRRRSSEASVLQSLTTESRFPKYPRVEDYLSCIPSLDQPGIDSLYWTEFRVRQSAGDMTVAEDLEPRLALRGLALNDRTTQALAQPTEFSLGGKRDSFFSELDPPQTREQRDASRRAVLQNQLEKQLGSRFEIVSCLGEGGFGVVFGGRDKDLARTVAIKVVTLSNRVGPTDRTKPYAEAKVLAQLDHPAIVPVYDVGMLGPDSAYIVSKWIEGASLSRSISTRSLSVLQAAKIVLRMAQALTKAHALGLVHRDIKPANILLDQDGQAFLCDFGLAVDFGPAAGPLIAGTPGYMSPEQAAGKSVSGDGRSDLFSLGVVFYELLTGSRPFQGNHEEQLRLTTSTDIPPASRSVANLHPLADSICSKLVRRDPNERYASAVELEHDLNRLISQLERGVRQEKTVKTGMRVGSLGCAIQVGVSLASIAILLTLGWYAMQGPSETMATNWGWDRPGVVGAELDARDYLESLASAAEEWNEVDRSTPSALETRLLELRHACDTLLASDHPALSPTDRAWLLDRCRSWRGRVVEQLEALERAEQTFDQIQSSSNELANNLVAALRSRASELG